MRKLVTVERIADLQPIPGADRIQVATVRGWKTVVKTGEFAEGDLCVFFEIDSFIPSTNTNRKVFGFLDGPNGGDKTRFNDDGEKGWVLKTVKLRGQYSQGLALPINLFVSPQFLDSEFDLVGTDFTDDLGVKVFERPMNAQQRGLARGTRPSFIPKTDEERLQNMLWALDKWQGRSWCATQKLDGSSMSVYFNGAEFKVGVASRNMDLKDVPESTFWQVAKNQGLAELIQVLFVDYALNVGITDRPKTIVLQGELFGGSIQGNPLNTGDPSFRAFNLIFDGEVIPRADWPTEILEISVPTFDLPFPKTLEEALAQADSVSTQIGQGKVEGIVWRDRDAAYDEDGNRLSFKVISNRYLLKNDR